MRMTATRLRPSAALDDKEIEMEISQMKRVKVDAKTIDTQKLRAAAQRVIDDSGDSWYDADQMGDPIALGLPEVDAQYIEAASPAAVAGLLDHIEALAAEVERLRHQVITCGVAARHPDADLTRTGSYAGKWNSQQAEDVRALRADRDRLRAALGGLLDALPSATTHPAIKRAKDALRETCHD